MDDQQRNPKSFSSRRRVVKSIVAATGVVMLAPHEWKTPLVKTVALPAHAQTSPECAILTDEIDVDDSCEEAPTGLELVYVGFLTNAPVGEASGEFDAAGSRWELLGSSVNPGNDRQFAVFFCFDPTLPSDTQVTINVTDENGGECSTTFTLDDVQVPAGP